jgi:hypothetical protein
LPSVVARAAHDDVPIADLSDDDAREACDGLFPLLQRLDAQVHGFTCGLGAEIATRAKGEPARCRAEYDECAEKPPACGEPRTKTQCAAVLRELACAATVGELAACVADAADALDAPLRAFCTDHPSVTPASPASCDVLARKCPKTSPLVKVDVTLTSGAVPAPCRDAGAR